MRLLEWGLFIKGRGCRMVIKILLSFHSFRKGQARGLAIPDDQARQANHTIQLLQQTLECSLMLPAFFANLLRDVPNQPDPAIQPNQACCVKPSLNGNSNSTASNCLNLRRIREQRLFSAAVAARILKLSASANHTASTRPNTRTYYTKKERQALSLKRDYPSDSSPAELTSRFKF